MKSLDFTEVIRAVIMLSVITVVGAIAYFSHSEAAIGALILVVGLGGQYFFHSKVVLADGTTVTPTLR